MKRFSLYAGAFLLVLATLSHGARAQCPDWSSGFEGNDLVGFGKTSVVHDDGSGPSLYVGGQFSSAGSVLASNVARWDGARWHAVGSGPNGIVYALAVFDEGAGPRLFAAGSFAQAGGLPARGIARWDGTSWTALGAGLGGQSWDFGFGARCMSLYDDGTGPALYVGGSFSSAGGASALGIARWDGASWSTVGGGVSYAPGNQVGSVLALAVHDDGSGPRLVAGGAFNRAGTVAVSSLARWNGSSWSGFGTGLNSPRIHTLAEFDEGSGRRLFAGGWISNINGAPANTMARWDGLGWSSVAGLGAGGIANSMFVHDDGTGPALWVGGSYLLGSTQTTLGRWNGTTWTPIPTAPTTMVGAAAFDEGQGARLFIVGDNSVGIGGAARWDGASWSVLHHGAGLEGYVNSAAVLESSGASALCVLSSVQEYTGPVQTVARWDGSTWTYVNGLPGVMTVIEAIGDGAAARLYAGIRLNPSGPALWRLENGTWSPIGGAFTSNSDTSVDALAEFDDGSGPALFVGGHFTGVGGVPAACVAKWDGAAWSTLGSGTSDVVYALKVWDDGSGPALYAAGRFERAGGLLVNRVARWDGTSWSALGIGVDSPGSRVVSLEVWNDGNGSALYAGGTFTRAGGLVVSRIARWGGTTWGDVGGGITVGTDNGILALHAHDDGSGSGSALYAGGEFAAMGGVPAGGVARWNGTSWSALGGSSSTMPAITARAFATFEDGTGVGPALFVGGSFTTVGDVPALNIARWTGCGSVGEALCAGDGSGTACPCGNASAVGEERGCLHVFGQGARLRSNGVPSVLQDSLVLRGDDMTPSSTCLYFQGTQAANGGAGAAFGDGLRCASGTVVRLGVRTNVLGASTWPSAGDPPLSSHGIAPGSARVYQVWYRSAAPFCTPSTFNWTNGLRVVWAD